jgi:hypothetical protein
VHALAGTARNCGVGDDVPVGDADWIMALAEQHGFRPAPFHGACAIDLAARRGAL